MYGGMKRFDARTQLRTAQRRILVGREAIENEERRIEEHPEFDRGQRFVVRDDNRYANESADGVLELNIDRTDACFWIFKAITKEWYRDYRTVIIRYG